MNESHMTSLKEINVHANLPRSEDKRLTVKVDYYFNEGEGYVGGVTVNLHLENRDYSFSELRELAVERANQVVDDLQSALQNQHSSQVDELPT